MIFNQDLLVIAAMVRLGEKTEEEVFSDISKLPGTEKDRQLMKIAFNEMLNFVIAREKETSKMNACYTDPDSWMSKRRDLCISGNHVKEVWIKTGEDSARRDHEPTTKQEECVFCKYENLEILKAQREAQKEEIEEARYQRHANRGRRI